MKSAARDGRLKDSDLIRADRIPGWEPNLLRTTVRVTKSGWAGCHVSTWHVKVGRIEVETDHRFSDDDLDVLRNLLEGVEQIEVEPITVDDVPILRLRVSTSSGDKSWEKVDWGKTKKKSVQNPAFDEIWNFIHVPFREFIASQLNEKGRN